MVVVVVVVVCVLWFSCVYVRVGVIKYLSLQLRFSCIVELLGL